MKNITLVLFCLIAQSKIYSQGNEYLDYFITKEDDTIYGTFRENFFKTVLLEKNKTPEKDGIAFYSHSLKNVKAYRYNDFVNVMKKSEDGLYPSIENLANVTKDSNQIKSDYIITAGDTLYGKITLPFFSKELILITAEGKKNKIKFPEVTSYCKDNFIYDYKKKEKIMNYDKDGDYLLRLYKGHGVNLYGYYQYGKFYYIEKDNMVYLMNMSLVSQLFNDDKELMNLITEGIYAYDNIYLMVKFYSRPERS
ncbi:hypothetical protein [Flavobacterium sp.]|uniref:hypothetical protein n=1 Tax=Flavobacterium sp. TaxID=239 RepID=UPI002B4ACB04|nr:hypothetical protein [Flavobacterium sp.]HLF52397.1 hypothetical protein [Flavobacterium sp.]